MARVTVEDCVLKIPNRFELVMLASQRAREIGAGSALNVDRDNDKNPVVALREIADTDLSLEELHESLVRNHQKVSEVEEETADIIDMMEGEGEWAAVASASAESELAVSDDEDAAGEAEEDAEDAGNIAMPDMGGDGEEDL